MKGIEFKSRQLWLDFECATSIALRVVADSIESFRNWFKEWKGSKPRKIIVNKSKWLWPEMTGIQQNFSFRVN